MLIVGGWLQKSKKSLVSVWPEDSRVWSQYLKEEIYLSVIETNYHFPFCFFTKNSKWLHYGANGAALTRIQQILKKNYL